MRKLWEFAKKYGWILGTVLWVFILSFVLFPSIINEFIPFVLTNDPVLGSSASGYTLEPLMQDMNLPFDNQMSDIGWSFGGYVLSAGEQSVDPRVRAIEMLLTQYGSPVAEYAEVFVQEADKNGNDWRLAVSIMGVESGFGKVIPVNSYNGWGWKGGPNGAYSIFSSWNESISHITERLATGYGKKITPLMMEAIYCPPCGATGMHYWANGVQNYMDILEYYRKAIVR
ncbi:glucosaminidase domain-containing protein [Candidatus Dojkabacteria bacterium]|nr:glucosaminidase domain-containing protein [Candidatus Dojkabacteria bacterium]